MTTDISDTIKRVAKVARIRIDEDEQKEFAADFKAVLDIFDTLDEADVSDITDFSIQPVQFAKEMRADDAAPSDKKDACLNLSKLRRDDFFKGPRVL
ncbi:MAG: Asp-tRNA(Asn)/Glu-tRNA(Gln) amidotransferase subunit GatC [Nanoarchaeota archaeon]